MKTISITIKDLQILIKDRGTLFQLFLLPLLFIIVFSGALNAIGQSAEVSLPDLAVVDQDGGTAALSLIKEIAADGSFAVKSYSATDAQSLLSENKAVGMLVIPAGFTTGVQQSQPVTLVFTIGTNADPQQVEAIRLVLESLSANMTLESQISASLEQMAEMQANAPAEYQIFSTERILAQAKNQFEHAQNQPLISVLQTTAQNPQTEATINLSQLAVPGFIVLFVFLAAQTTARSIHEEKKIGSFRRLVAAPISKIALLTGKILPNFITGLVQIAVILVFSSIGLRLMGLTPLPIERDPVGTLLTSAVLALCSSALGIAIAALARTEGQISGLSTLLLWGMGLLGGCLVPLFILERFLGPIPMIVPHYWANRALDDLLIRGLSLSEIAIDLVVLLGFSLLFFVIGLWRFDYER